MTQQDQQEVEQPVVSVSLLSVDVGWDVRAHNVLIWLPLPSLAVSENIELLFHPLGTCTERRQAVGPWHVVCGTAAAAGGYRICPAVARGSGRCLICHPHPGLSIHTAVWTMQALEDNWWVSGEDLHRTLKRARCTMGDLVRIDPRECAAPGGRVLRWTT